jgi:acyl-CoA synthetase (AMP-forming)/AMP-acid ligase II
MTFQLTVAAVLRRAEQYASTRTVASREPDRSIHLSTWAQTGLRARQAGSALLSLGLAPGARVASLCYSHRQHLELYYGVPMAGLALHPLNPRLHPDDIAYIAAHAGDQALVVDAQLYPLYERIRDRTPFRHVVVVGDGPAGTRGYDELLSAGDPAWDPPDADENATALVGYTSGTTGRPKGVEVPHRAIVLHALSSALPGWLAFRDSDVVMPVVPMYHAMAWGWPYTSALTGAALVLPGPYLDPASLAELIAAERVTLTGGVPTIWLGLLQLLDDQPGRYDLSSLRAILSGGSTAPPSMIDGYARRHGLNLVHTWGMTELMMGATATLTADLQNGSPEERRRARLKQGLPMPLVETRARGEHGLVPWDGSSLGELEVRGPWIAREYLSAPEASADRWTLDGWFRTGDIVRIDSHGYIEISDRAKDLIKSGGEWISTPTLEGALMAHPAVAEAAVIGVPDGKWGERPLAVVTLRPEATASADELRTFLAGKVARWQVPERVEFTEAIPKTAVGKLDKVALRKTYGA